MSARVAPVQFDVEREFLAAMHSAGYSPGPIEANSVGFKRFDAPGDKKGRETGFYRVLSGQYPVGWFGDWRTGTTHEWQWDHGRELTKKERDQIKAEHRRLKAEAQVAREAKQREVAERASDMWKRSSTDVSGHPYLKAKGIETLRGARLYTAADATKLIAVPMHAFDYRGELVLINLQLIGPDGSKRFLAGGRVEGAMFILRGDTSIILECEGVATGATLSQATGMTVACAFNAGNLIEVAKEIARHRPIATLMVCGDDDVVQPEDWPSDRIWKNAGRLKAEAAARAVGCRWIMPKFAAGNDRQRTDFNDLHREEGIEMVSAQVVGAIRGIDPEPGAPSAEVVEPDFIQDESWRTKLPITSSGKVDAANVESVAIYLQNHRALRNRLTFNHFTQAIELDGNDMADHHVAEFRRIMHADGLKAKKPDVVDEMIAEARRHPVDPQADYLAGLKWDGQKRIDSWLHNYLGAELTLFCTSVARKFLIGSVARALNPGCKNDVALILEGPQGAGKSTAIRYLYSDRFFVDNLPDFHSKDSFQQLQGYWCVEIAELSALGKADVGDVKKFLSRLVDVYRPPFGKLPIKVPRRCVFVGTINPDFDRGYLKDSTGGRRFWPVTVAVEGRPILLDAILRDRDQLWAEAVHAYRSGEPWYLTDVDEIISAEAEQEARREVDPWEDVIAAWMVGAGASVQELTIQRALEDVVKMPPERQTFQARKRMGTALRKVGWKSKNVRPVGGKPVLTFYRETAPGLQMNLPDAWRED